MSLREREEAELVRREGAAGQGEVLIDYTVSLLGCTMSARVAQIVAQNAAIHHG